MRDGVEYNQYPCKIFLKITKIPMRQLIFYYTVAFMFDDFVLLYVVVNILCISRQNMISHDILSTLPQITQCLSHSGIGFNSQIFKPSLNYLFLLNILQKKVLTDV